MESRTTPRDPQPGGSAFLYLTVFVCGCVTLAIELSASRLLDPVLGTSNIIWAAIIGLILLYLALGYWLGGRWADRSPHPHVLYSIIAWSGLLVGLVPFAAQPVLQWATTGMLEYNLDALASAFLAVLILLSAPITLLGCVSPFAIRLAMQDVTRAGNVAGNLYAISTAGSFIGTFLPVLVLIPNFGTRTTFLILASILLIVAALGLGQRRIYYAWMPIAVALFAAFMRGQPIKPIPNAVFETESSYNYIQVLQEQTVRYLCLNEGQGIHSIYNMAGGRTYGTWDYFTIAPYLNPPATAQPPARVAVVGLAAGTVPRLLTEWYGAVPIDGIEIDPAIVQVGREWFAMNQPNLNVWIGDGRYVLSRLAERYSVIGIDAYRLPYIPWHLTTIEFFQMARDHLTNDGVVVINVGHTDDDWRLVSALAATLQTVFTSVHVVNVPQTFNAIIYATMLPTTPDNLRLNQAAMPHPMLQAIAAEAWNSVHPVAPSDIIFTDDKAPVEQLTNGIVLQYLLNRMVNNE